MSDYHVIGVYKTRDGASAAVDRLLDEGFGRDRVSVLVSEEAKDRWLTVSTHTKAAEGAAAGGVAGGALGALIIGLTSAGAVAIPGIGLLISGPLLAALAGAGAGGAAGTAVGGLVGLGFSESEIKHVAGKLKEDCIAVGVQVADKGSAHRAGEIFEETGALQTTSQAGRRLRE